MTTRMAAERRARRAAVERHAEDFGGVVSRRDLRRLGVTRHQIRRHVEAGRWVLHGRQTVATHSRPLSPSELRWRAVWEVGAGAALDGVSALQAAGVTTLSEAVIHVSVPHGTHVSVVSGVRVHRVVRRLDDELVPVGIPRTRPALAAVRAAQWAGSDRQAALLLCVGVQQRVMTATALCRAADRAPGRRRRAFVRQVIADIVDGAQSLGELDFGLWCRRRGLPAPRRQVLRQGPRGRIYLDVRWTEFGVAVEIDGAFHRVGLAVTDDNLRQNHVVLSGDLILRIDLIGLRLAATAFMDQVEAALRSRGWCRGAPHTARTHTEGAEA